MDSWLRLRGIRFQCVIGVTERERAVPQEVVVDVDVKVDFSKPASSDALADTVDYRRLSRRVIEVGAGSRCALVETLSSRLCRVVLDEFPEVEEVRLELEKPGALSTAASVRAVIAAHRDQR
jgi:dihydroneopterin aldolase